MSTSPDRQSSPSLDHSACQWQICLFTASLAIALMGSACSCISIPRERHPRPLGNGFWAVLVEGLIDEPDRYELCYEVAPGRFKTIWPMVGALLIEGDRAVFRGYGKAEDDGTEEWLLFAARRGDVCVDITRRALRPAAASDPEARALRAEPAGCVALRLESAPGGLALLYTSRAVLARYQEGLWVYLTWDDIDRFLDEAQQAAPPNKSTRRP